MDVFINGEKAKEAFEQLQKSTSLKIQRDEETGKITASGEVETVADKKLQQAITDENTIVNVNASSNVFTRDGAAIVGGAFGGNATFAGGKYDGKIEAQQQVNPGQLAIIDEFTNSAPGVGMLHEVLEAYIGGERYPNMQPVTSSSSEADLNRFDNSVHGEANRLDPRHKEIEVGVIDGGLYIRYEGKQALIADLKKK
jgi:hypothetical protein